MKQQLTSSQKETLIVNVTENINRRREMVGEVDGVVVDFSTSPPTSSKPICDIPDVEAIIREYAAFIRAIE